MTDLPPLPRSITHEARAPEGPLLESLVRQAGLTAEDRDAIAAQGARLVRRVRESGAPGLMEAFLAEYGLSTPEGVALMCLAEALLRVPDTVTMDALIEDKIAPGDWGRHLGDASSPLLNASTWALMLTGKVLDEREPGMAGHLRAVVKRLGEPMIRRAARRAMKEIGRQFVLGENIATAMERAGAMEAAGYTYSYDMLGEAAHAEADAQHYFLAYRGAIAAAAAAARSDDVRANPGVSVKLSALHPRFEVASRSRILDELVARVLALARLAKETNLGFNIDAEEADRLALSLEVIARVLGDPGLRGWDGFGVVVQSYGRRASAVIDWVHALAERLERRLMVRLVKGAYWDVEVKRAQVLGLESFPVFTRKAATDVSYISNARKLLGMSDRIYLQFATHNAHTVAAILHMGAASENFEFQRLHGMGEPLHQMVREKHGTRCRIYAPVGTHRDLLAYLVRRLLENGANSSFVHQILDGHIPPEQVAGCPFAVLEAAGTEPDPAVTPGPALFGSRINSAGFDLADPADLERIESHRGPWMGHMFEAGPVIAGPVHRALRKVCVDPAYAFVDDAEPSVQIPAKRRPPRAGYVQPADPGDVATALAAARTWDVPAAERAAVLRRAAGLYEAQFGPIFALLARESGKTLPDTVAELREAVDFLRYYAEGVEGLARPARGTFVCISPWNFPLAIFTGQVAAALAAGNAVLAKPAEQTPLVAAFAVNLLHEAGVPREVLQFMPGDGATVGGALTSDPRIAGVAFTGSTDTARIIRRALAEHAPEAVLIAETGGLNAMVVDSSALPEQVVRDVIASAFQSAGQRCSALRCLYVQKDIANMVEEMLLGAMDELALGDPADLSTDIGPVIDAAAAADIRAHVDEAHAQGRVLKALSAPAQGHFVGPTVIRVSGIADLQREVFGPILHWATFEAEAIDSVIDAVNATGYGLTFGLHTRMDARVQHVVDRVRAGNIYVNRNQIGAVVGSQPFGGEGFSGTGPKAGGPAYLHRFSRGESLSAGAWEHPMDPKQLQLAMDRVQRPQTRVAVRDLPGPTGESNRLSTFPRGPILCLGPGAGSVAAQAEAVHAVGGIAVGCTGALEPHALETLRGFAAAVWWGDPRAAQQYQMALARRGGPLLPLIREIPDSSWVLVERHVCIDTTAAGGNARLLADVGR
jgi:RHH-type transcriptional regulator, proline utilization regulon repressor / proline dehydrogenase / delta 1-pyrroline-5-carboxylate dehydrogenase